jgi:hypothetical protein
MSEERKEGAEANPTNKNSEVVSKSEADAKAPATRSNLGCLPTVGLFWLFALLLAPLWNQVFLERPPKDWQIFLLFAISLVLAFVARAVIRIFRARPRR